MKKLSYKIKSIVLVAGFIAFAVAMFLYGYSILDNRNQLLAIAATEKQTEYELLMVEQRTFLQGQKDLASLSEKSTPPNELFSKDTKVVKEIKVLEDIASQNGLTMDLSIAGSTETAKPADGTLSGIFVIPYTLTLEGSFEGMMRFLQAAEHLPFASRITLLDIGVDTTGSLRGSFNSEFYIKE